MGNKILIFLVFNFSSYFAQEISTLNNCDTTDFFLLEKTNVLIENGCSMNGPEKQFYFTSYKEFSDYYNNSKYPPNEPCRPLFNNFNFKKYNMLLINYSFSQNITKSITIDVKYKLGKYYFLIKHTGNFSGGDLLLPGNLSKCFYLPKEKSVSKPEIIYCVINSKD